MLWSAVGEALERREQCAQQEKQGQFEHSWLHQLCPSALRFRDAQTSLVLHQQRRAFDGFAAVGNRMIAARRRTRGRDDGKREGQPEGGVEFIQA
jgi:hypothetical protein